MVQLERKRRTLENLTENTKFNRTNESGPTYI